MATSKYSKSLRSVRTVANGTGIGGGQTRLALNRDHLVGEHIINVAVSQANGGIAPTSVDVRDFIASVALETSDGRPIYLTGAQAYDLSRFTENAPRVVNVLGATSTSVYAFELHHENDGALLDLLTAMRSNELSTVDLVITWAADSANGFKGQTVPSAAAYTVSVQSADYEMLTEKQFGQMLGVGKHFQEKIGSKTLAVAGAASQPDIDLITGGLVRFIGLHAYNTTGVATLADTVLGELRLNINGKDVRVFTADDLRRSNSSKRGFNETGVVFIDFGDDERGWLDLRNVRQAKLQWATASTNPAASRVDICQDFTRSAMQ
jgi:hypothetical protein